MNKNRSPDLSRTLFLVMGALLKTPPADETVFQFLNKVCDEDNPYLVYITAATNMLLRDYYGRVKEYTA